MAQVGPSQKKAKKRIWMRPTNKQWCTHRTIPSLPPHFLEPQSTNGSRHIHCTSFFGVVVSLGDYTTKWTVVLVRISFRLGPHCWLVYVNWQCLVHRHSWWLQCITQLDPAGLMIRPRFWMLNLTPMFAGSMPSIYSLETMVLSFVCQSSSSTIQFTSFDDPTLILLMVAHLTIFDHGLEMGWRPGWNFAYFPKGLKPPIVHIFA